MATVTYLPENPGELYCVGAPVEIKAFDRNGNLMRQRTGTYDAKCRTTKLESLVARGGTDVAVAEFEYWDENQIYDGNLKKVISPENHRGERYWVTYTYDGVIGAHVTYTEDVHGYKSWAGYDYKYGENDYTKDVNGQVTRRSFDAFGRLKEVAAPGFTLVTAPTIRIDYAHDAAVPHARTKNALPQSNNTLDTVVLMDGLGRVIQTKKTAEIRVGRTARRRRSAAVTGHQTFDVIGRVASRGRRSSTSHHQRVLRARTPKNATRLFYDALGRTVQTVERTGDDARRVRIGVPRGNRFKRLSRRRPMPWGRCAPYRTPGTRLSRLRSTSTGARRRRRTTTTRWASS
jgi:hypothetical protein